MMAGPNLLASSYMANCLRPATGTKFISRAYVVEPGKSQVFTDCDLYALGDDGEKLVANEQSYRLFYFN